MINRVIRFLLLFILAIIFSGQDKIYAWGWQTHYYINEHAVDYLPPEMEIFQEYKEYIRSHATDPDSDNQPGYYHYIDIDYYPEFFEGTFPYIWEDAVAQYGESVLADYGTVPWVIEEWTDSLSSLIASGQWDDVWQISAELGHYVADSHQPLHLTLNYNGQSSGNYGIHSRYETHMMNDHLSELPLPDSSSVYWDSVIDSTFNYIENTYPYVSDILAADDLASAQDPNHNSTYYSILWNELDTLTIHVVHSAIIDLATIWRTAWINAGNPILSLNDYNVGSGKISIHPNFPNPFNPITTLHYDLPKDAMIRLAVYDITGREIKTLVHSKQTAGAKSIQWNGTNNAGELVSAGLYLYTIESGKYHKTRKMVLLK
ncbi:FlgD immunoglobulin-like domain containing protein [Candidatus Marinimicrobia bacterium]|nr:FlgD immunoglobulin-like domain containing protein [Candidatus Neomarinimicrobiota bacterium]